MAETSGENIGRVIEVRGQTVRVSCDSSYLPELREMLVGSDDGEVRMEVNSYENDHVLRALLLCSPEIVQRNLPVQATGSEIQIPVDRSILGRIINLYGDVKDGGEPLQVSTRRSIYQTDADQAEKQAANSAMEREEIQETGIKVIDYLHRCPGEGTLVLSVAPVSERRFF